MELTKVTDKTYYIENPSKIGIYKIDDENIYLIDTGNDKDAGKKILKIIEEQNLKIQGIINTHSHADHIGGNKIIQDKTNCKIYASQIEKDIINNPIFEPTMLYGAYPFNDLKNKFLEAQKSFCRDLIEINGLEYINLPGHSYNMIGIKTSDNIYFLADSLMSEETINKYHIFFLYNVEDFLNTLDYLETLEGKLFIPSHAPATTDIKSLIKINRNKVNEILNTLLNIVKNKLTFGDIIKEIFDQYNITINTNQYFLISSTIKAYITYLIEKDKITYEFINNKMYYMIKEF